MKHKKIIILICSLAVVFSLLLKPSASQATDAVGGQVNTGGKIIFYEETLPPEATLSSSENVEKSAGSFPSTGEIIQRAWPMTGVLLLFLLLYLLERRKEKNS